MHCKLKAGWGLALTHNPWYWSDTAVIAVLVDFQTLFLRASGESDDTKDSWWKAGRHVYNEFWEIRCFTFITFQMMQTCSHGCLKEGGFCVDLQVKDPTFRCTVASRVFWKLSTIQSLWLNTCCSEESWKAHTELVSVAMTFQIATNYIGSSDGAPYSEKDTETTQKSKSASPCSKISSINLRLSGVRLSWVRQADTGSIAFLLHFTYFHGALSNSERKRERERERERAQVCSPGVGHRVLGEFCTFVNRYRLRAPTSPRQK